MRQLNRHAGWSGICGLIMLMLAAPDLLAACEMALELIVPLRMAGRGPVVDSLRAAIAKAEGKPAP